jgi:monothiol glutaredoxin
MGIRNEIKKRLPIFGRYTAPVSPEPSNTTTNTTVEKSVTPVVETVTGRGDSTPEAYIEKVVTENKIVIFMKGSPSSPLCGFSANASSILGSFGKPFFHVDVIADYEVREAVKTYSQWPTLPQIYINGEFLGGSDILREMYADGSLQKAIEDAFAG